jgi:Ca2+-binding EF-hand superfamily protein
MKNLKIAALTMFLTCAAGVVSAADSGENGWLLAKYDLNGDERITQTEITSKKRNIFKHMDSDSDGGISFNEYESMDMTKRQTLLKSRFNKLDLDQDGRLTENEYCNYMGMFDSIDSDGNGELTSVEMGVEKAENTSTHCLLWFCVRSELD